MAPSRDALIVFRGHTHTRKVPGTVLNSKVALAARWTSLTEARRGSSGGRLGPNNVTVMAFVISISVGVLKDGALNGGISVDLGLNAAAIKPRHLYLLLTRLFASHYLPAAGKQRLQR